MGPALVRRPAMHAVTSLMRVQQLVIGRLDAILKPHGLTFARYEALVLLVFSSRGSLPLGKMGERLQVHPTSVTSIVQRLEAPGFVVRRPHPEDGRAVLAEITDAGRAVVERATADLRRRRLRPRRARPTTSSRRSPRCWPRSGTPPATSEPSHGHQPTTYAGWRWRCRAATRSQVRGRWKFRVKQIVYVAFSRDEHEMGFGFPKAERDGLIASDPETFFLPPTSDLRYQWVCAHLDRLDQDEMRELVVDAWRMCTPKMLHELPEQPPPTAAAWAAMDAGEWGELRPLLHPYLHWTDGDVHLRGRSNVLAHLQAHPTPRPPREVEVRDGQVYRWVR